MTEHLKDEMKQRYKDFLAQRNDIDNLHQLSNINKNLKYGWSMYNTMIVDSILEIDETGFQDAGYKEYIKKQKANSDLNFIDDEISFDDERNGDHES